MAATEWIVCPSSGWNAVINDVWRIHLQVTRKMDCAKEESVTRKSLCGVNPSGEHLNRLAFSKIALYCKVVLIQSTTYSAFLKQTQ